MVGLRARQRMAGWSHGVLCSESPNRGQVDAAGDEAAADDDKVAARRRCQAVQGGNLLSHRPTVLVYTAGLRETRLPVPTTVQGSRYDERGGSAVSSAAGYNATLVGVLGS